MSTTTTTTPPVVVDPPARRGTAAIVGLGVALLGAAVVVSWLYTRRGGDIDWSNYAVGLGATAALLLIALAGAVGHDLAVKRALTGFPGAVAAVAAGAMVDVGFDGEDWVQWAVGGAILGVSVLAYLLGRAGAPTVTAVLGLLVLYGKAVDEVLDLDDESLIEQGAAVVVFTVAVTALFWVLPQRALVGVTVGAFAVFSLTTLLESPLFLILDGGDLDDLEFLGNPGFSDNELYVSLAYAAGLVLLWTLAAWASGSTGFRVLAVLLSAVVVPSCMIWLAAEHPTWWGAGLAVAGGLVLLLALVAGRRAHRAAAPPPADAPPPEPFFDSPRHPPPPAGSTTTGEASPNPPPGKSDATVIAPASAPPPPDPQNRRPT